MLRESKLRRQREEAERKFLKTVLSSATLAQKMEVIRDKNPLFYLLTPKPQRKQGETNETN